MCSTSLLAWAFTVALAAAQGVAARRVLQGDVAAGSRCFPSDFLFGTATSAFQTEGALNATGRTPSIWDDKCLEIPSMDCVNSAADFFHRYKSDVALMTQLGLGSFRFSISWSRVMTWDPASRRMKPNAPGIAFYHDLIDELIANNIVRVLTIFHGDVPLALKTELSPPSWENAAMVDHFVEFADLVYREFGHKVDYWATFNEPYSAIVFENTPDVVYNAGHNLLLAHGHAVQRFRELKTSGVIGAKAQVSIVLSAEYSYPLDPTSDADVAAADRRVDFYLGWYLQPIVSGEYPKSMRDRAGARLPEFTADERALLTGSYDLFMLNHYSSRNVADCASPQSTVTCSELAEGVTRDLGVDTSHFIAGARRSSTGADGAYLCPDAAAFPQGYRDTIKWMHRHDPSARILLTENGWCGNTTIDNQDQVWYHTSYLEQVYEAMVEDNVPIIGYTIWSLLDNYEWGSYKPRFGLYHVEYPANVGSKDGFEPTPQQLARTPRSAATWYARVATTKCLDEQAPPSCGDASA